MEKKKDLGRERAVERPDRLAPTRRGRPAGPSDRPANLDGTHGHVVVPAGGPMEVRVADYPAVLATNDRAEEPRADARVRRQLIAPEPDETRRLARKVRRHVVIGEPADLGAVFA